MSFDYPFEEHMHALEVEHELTHSCMHEQATGDKQYPVLCARDNKYATRTQCFRCAKRSRYA